MRAPYRAARSRRVGWVRLACERHRRDRQTGAARGLRWDLPAALRVITFFEDVLVLAEGEFAGQPFRLKPWHKFIVGSLFGWHLGAYRRFNTAYLEVGKGNGKIPMAAGIGLYCLTSDGEAGGQVYSAATTRDQAKIVWSDAARMVAASPELRGRIVETVNNLSYAKSGSFFRPVSADASKLDGLRPSCVLVDEVHEHPSSAVIEKMRAGFKGRRSPLLIEITNSGFDRHSICWQHHEYSAKVLEGTIEADSWFAYVCALAEGESQSRRVDYLEIPTGTGRRGGGDAAETEYCQASEFLRVDRAIGARDRYGTGDAGWPTGGPIIPADKRSTWRAR